MTAADTDLLAELIQQKHACLVQLRDLGKRQWETLLKGNMTDLLDVLAAKQRVLLRLQQVAQSLEVFRNQDPNQRPWPDPQRRRQCADTLSECQALLGEILEQEKRSERELISRRDQAAALLESMQQAGQARGAYTAQNHSLPGQIDLISEL